MTLAPFFATSRITGEPLEPAFSPSSTEEVNAACEAAYEAFLVYRNVPGAERAAFLNAIADELEARTEAIVERYQQETGLPEARARGELGRTTGQLRLFAGVTADGSYADPRVVLADADRKPIPKPDLRALKRPVGPVAVFGASNFALAFSVAGGDTASALAAGCPVVAKAHPAHPGVSLLAGEAIMAAADRTGMPGGVFSLVFDQGYAVGQQLVANPRIAAVGFTGSRRGGMALHEIAQKREVPIPVYAEMSSINPVFIFPSKADDAVGMLAGSLTMGVGQFCTNPGLPILVDGEADAFLSALAAKLSEVGLAPMLTEGIADAYERGISTLAGQPEVTTHLAGSRGAPALFSVPAADFLANPLLQEEVFGPSALVVLASAAEALQIAEAIEGQLTATFLVSEEDVAELVGRMEMKAGRLLFNQMPTGLEVCSSTVHGGPYPATLDGRTTSVGTWAIDRWLRLVAWQNAPSHLLPTALR